MRYLLILMLTGSIPLKAQTIDMFKTCDIGLPPQTTIAVSAILDYNPTYTSVTSTYIALSYDPEFKSEKPSNDECIYIPYLFNRFNSKVNKDNYDCWVASVYKFDTEACKKYKCVEVRITFLDGSIKDYTFDEIKKILYQ